MKTYIKFISALLLTATMSPFLSSCGDEPEVSDETDTDTSTDTSSSKPSNTINGHKFVDLGLPSGLLWADRNVGADSPYDYGDFFAWGETKTKTKVRAYFLAPNSNKRINITKVAVTRFSSIISENAVCTRQRLHHLSLFSQRKSKGRHR